MSKSMMFTAALAATTVVPAIANAQVISESKIQEKVLAALFRAPFAECELPDPSDPTKTVIARAEVVTQLQYIEGVDRADQSRRDRVYVQTLVRNPCGSNGSDTESMGCINSTPDDGFCPVRAIYDTKPGTVAGSLQSGSVRATLPTADANGCLYTVDLALNWRATDDNLVRWRDHGQFEIDDNGLGSGPLRILVNSLVATQPATSGGTISLKPWRDPTTGGVAPGCSELDPRIPTNVALGNVLWSEWDPDHVSPYTWIANSRENTLERIKHVDETEP
jgi:hypothetical protein